jgi:hypothetical protein
MKIALCLHGLFSSNYDKTSTGDNGVEYIKKNIMSKGDVDVYIHSWQSDLKSKLEETYNPIDSKYEPQILFEDFIKAEGLDTLRNSPRPPLTILSHFYSIQESFKLLYNSDKKYDFVIKSRFDLGQVNRNSSTLNVECINFDSRDRNKERLNMAWWPDRFMLSEGPPDMWFYSGMEIMRPFSNIYDHIKNYMKKDSPHREEVKVRLGEKHICNASVLYKKFLEDNNLWDNKNTIVCEKN